MGRIVIPRPRLRSGGASGQVQLQRPPREPRVVKPRPLTMKQKYGVSEYELIRLGLDAAIGLGGRAAASSETARRRRQRAAQAEGATDVPASAEAFLAQFSAEEVVEAPAGVESPRERGAPRVDGIIAGTGAGAPEDRPTSPGGESASDIAGRAHQLMLAAEEQRTGPDRGPEMDRALSGAWSRVESEFKRANDLAWRTNDENAKAESLRGLSILYSNLKRPEEARQEMTAALATERQAASLGARPYQWHTPPEQRVAAAPGPAPTAPPPGLSAVAPQQSAQAPPMAQPTPQQRRASYIPTTLGEAQAMARFATTQEEMAIAMEHIDQLARAGSLEDAITGAHIRRAQEAALRGWRPPRGETALDRAQLANIRQRTETSRLSAEYTRKRMEALQNKMDAATEKAIKSGRQVSTKPSRDKRVFQNVMAHRKYERAYQEGTGIFSGASIAERLNREHGESRQYTPGEIQERRDGLWRNITGDLHNATAEDREALARGELSSSREGKKYNKIITGVQASDEKARADAGIALRAGVSAEQRDERIKLAEQRLQLAMAKAARTLSPAQIKVAEGAARRDAAGNEEVYFDSLGRTLAAMMAAQAQDAAEQPAADDDVFVEEMTRKYAVP